MENSLRMDFPKPFCMEPLPRSLDLHIPRYPPRCQNKRRQNAPLRPAMYGNCRAAERHGLLNFLEIPLATATHAHTLQFQEPLQLNLANVRCSRVATTAQKEKTGSHHPNWPSSFEPNGVGSGGKTRRTKQLRPTKSRPE